MSGAAKSPDFDVAVVGGGLIGASLACALAPLGYRVAVVEAVSHQAPAQPSFDDRTLALSRSSCQILEGIGVWPSLRDDATPIRQIVVSEQGRPGRVVLDPGELGLAAFGHVVEARRFGAALLAAMERLDGVELMSPVTVTGVERSADRVRLDILAEGQPGALQARLLVAADGASSTVRRLLEVPVVRHDYGQTAVICNVSPERSHRGRAFERFTPTGPFAVLPHGDDRCGLVWTVSSADAERLLAMPEAEFRAGAQARFGGELGGFVRAGRRSAYPLRLVRARHDTLDRVVILGNAAHAIHPVGAQGFNLGCRDVAVLAELLAGPGSPDPGDPAVLRAYSAWRRPDQEHTVALSDGMARLFSNPSPVASLLRSAGLIAHGLMPPLRRRLAAGAMGYRGRIPRLARGLALERSR